MSLQLAAQHLASKGRGPDTMLVHMAPAEVKSLQTLALAHGGSLTVNPDTGLPEAGFLESILPTIAGVGLTALSGGTLSPLMAGLLVGGGTGLVTGDLRKGLMAGLGAYGGAGIGSVISGAGSAAAASELAATNQNLAAQLGADANAKDILLARSTMAPGPVMQSYQASPMTAGIKAIANKPSILLNKENMKYGLAALAPMGMMEEEDGPKYSGSGPNPYQYIFDPGRLNPPLYGGAGEALYFRPSYRRFAAGGPVEDMSDRNAQETFLANGGQRFADGGKTASPQYMYDPVAQRYTLLNAPTAGAVRTVTRMPGEYGGDIGPSSMPTPAGNINPNSLTGGLIPALVGQQNPNNVPVVDLSTYGPGTFGGGNFGADNDDAAMGAGIAAANQAAAAQAAQTSGAPSGPGVEVGGPISSGNAVGVDIGGFGGDNDDAGIGAAISDAAISDAVVASDASSGVSDGGGSADGPGGGSGDLARGGLTALQGAFSRGGYNLGDYSDGGRLLRGPGDGVSDSIPATIANKRPARLADGEFVVPARIVSELGNGSTEAGARKLYAMMDRIQRARRKTVGKGRVAVNSRAEKLLPA